MVLLFLLDNTFINFFMNSFIVHFSYLYNCLPVDTFMDHPLYLLNVIAINHLGTFLFGIFDW